jgi:hypothetical protein
VNISIVRDSHEMSIYHDMPSPIVRSLKGQWEKIFFILFPAVLTTFGTKTIAVWAS